MAGVDTEHIAMDTSDDTSDDSTAILMPGKQTTFYFVSSFSQNPHSHLNVWFAVAELKINKKTDTPSIFHGVLFEGKI